MPQTPEFEHTDGDGEWVEVQTPPPPAGQKVYAVCIRVGNSEDPEATANGTLPDYVFLLSVEEAVELRKVLGLLIQHHLHGKPHEQDV